MVKILIILMLLSTVCFGQYVDALSKLSISAIAGKDSVNIYMEALNGSGSLTSYKVPLDSLLQYGSTRLAASIATVTSTSTIDSTYGIILVNATSGSITLNLTAVASLQTGKRFIIKRTDSSANTVTVDPSSSETIDDETTQTLNQYDCLEIFSDGSEWWIK